jgi:hypothetical protein
MFAVTNTGVCGQRHRCLGRRACAYGGAGNGHGSTTPARRARGSPGQIVRRDYFVTSVVAPDSRDRSGPSEAVAWTTSFWLRDTAAGTTSNRVESAV